MTPTDLDELSRLYAAATKGPWSITPAVSAAERIACITLVAAMHTHLPALLKAARDAVSVSAVPVFKASHSGERDPASDPGLGRGHQSEATSPTPPADEARVIAPCVNELFDFINEPPQYEELRLVRDYRHELARKLFPVMDEIKRLAALPAAPAVEGEVEEALRTALREHWLTGIHCDHEAQTDVATCYCSVWKSDPLPSVGAAVDAWIEHLLTHLQPVRDGGWQTKSEAEARMMITRGYEYLHHKILGDQRVNVTLPKPPVTGERE